VKSGRNLASAVLVATGALLLLFAILWWTVALKRVVRFPGNVALSVTCEGTVEMMAATHGLEPVVPPDEYDFTLERRLESVNEDYAPSSAVVDEVVEQVSSGFIPLDLNEKNTYVFDRRDCANVKSRLSLSSGTEVDRSGSWYVNFPLGTSKDSYNLFNNDVASTFAVNFQKSENLQGLGVYIFSGSFRQRPIVDWRAGARGLPGETTFGSLKEEVEAAGVPLEKMIQAASPTLTSEERETIDQYPDDRVIGLEYSEEHAWEAAVEPVTGTVVDVSRYEMNIYVNTKLEDFLPLLEILARHAEDPLVSRYMSQIEQQKVLEPKPIYRVTREWSDDSVSSMVDYARSRIGPVRFYQDYMVIVVLLIGAASLVTGLVLRRERYHRAGPREDDSPDSEGEAR
jgi:hypothetical protein